MSSVVQIGRHIIGRHHACFVIAEAGVNHNGDLRLAKRLVAEAAAAGANAVKFQTFKAENVVTPKAPKAAYQLDTTDQNESQIDMLRKLELDPQEFAELMSECAKHGILFLSTPHDPQSIDVLEKLGVQAYKIGSGDVTNLPFLREVASRGKPILLSTGMSTLGEVESALAAIRGSGNESIILLHCVSNYPAAIEDTNLRAMRTMESALHVPTGFSDHTQGDEAALAAVALGACAIEKHFTLDHGMTGPDHLASAEPQELASLIARIRAVECALGDGLKRPTEAELGNRSAVRKSVVAACDIPAGTRIERSMLAIKRPGTGLPPETIDDIAGMIARAMIERDVRIEWRMLDG
ncbi:N-acetylneuraminate synthase [Candidatus Bipolaricaulota bacterium]